MVFFVYKCLKVLPAARYKFAVWTYTSTRIP